MIIRRKTFLALGAAGASTALLAACGNSDTTGSNTSDSGGSSDPGSPSRANADLVIWADDKKAPALEGPAKAWGSANGMSVAVQVVPPDKIQAAFVTANQAGNGPDVVLGAHDWIGNLVQNGAISPVQLPADTASSIAPVGMNAVTFNGQTYGVPYAVEALVLYANKKLTDMPSPKSIEELVKAGGAKGAQNILSLPVGQKGDPYHMEPLYTSAGGYLFGKGPDGSLDPKDLGVGKEGSIAAGEKMKELGAQGVLKTSITGANSISLFTEGKAAYLVSGPWALADVKKSGIDYQISPIPGFEGMQPARPFAGVNAFYVASKGKNAVNAQTFVNDVASSPDIIEAMFAKNQLPPVNLALQKKLAATNPEIIQMAKIAETADPMPSIPAMSQVWEPLGQAEANIVGGADPKATMESAGKAIASKIK